ncbi:hypothetical protein BJX99DRAFT_158507 [Aspergillus californicus]
MHYLRYPFSRTCLYSKALHSVVSSDPQTAVYDGQASLVLRITYHHCLVFVHIVLCFLLASCLSFDVLYAYSWYVTNQSGGHRSSDPAFLLLIFMVDRKNITSLHLCSQCAKHINLLKVLFSLQLEFIAWLDICKPWP